MTVTGTDVRLAAKLLKEGELVAIPTETVYGLAANACDDKAVVRIFEAKQRPLFDPLILHFANVQSVSDFAELKAPLLQKLAEKFWPGPLTLLLPKKENVSDLVTAGMPNVGVRVPGHELTLELLRHTGFPLAAPSANPFGYISPTSPAHVLDQLGGRVSYILNGGESKVGLESTIVGLEEGRLCIYRLGGISVEAIEAVAGKAELRLNQSSNPRAPGQLKSHYAPLKPLFLGDLAALSEAHQHKSKAVIYFGPKPAKVSAQLWFPLSPEGDLNEAAVNLFRSLRLADQSDAEIVLCEKVPDHGLGKAINDRLTRAAAR